MNCSPEPKAVAQSQPQTEQRVPNAKALWHRVTRRRPLLVLYETKTSSNSNSESKSESSSSGGCRRARSLICCLSHLVKIALPMSPAGVCV